MSDIYFGTKEYAHWIRAFAPGITYQPVGYPERLQFLNGGTASRQSFNAHMEYTLTWPNTTRDRVRQVTDFAYGIYGMGYIYWLDPVAMDKNLFNLGWSTPGIATMDALPLVGTTRPERVINGDQSLGYPAVMARYSVTPGDAARSFYAPVPAGYTAWIGAHGDISDQGLTVRQTIAGTPVGTPASVPVLGVDDSTRFSTSISGGNQGGIEISLDTTATATITLAGLILQVLPNGKTPPRGG
jgi:hypothetical protein